jgi:hypoxanthine-guanine phosphoribosyltransferase
VVPDDFFVGYGFDYRQSFRNLPYVAYLQIGPDQPTLF